MNENKQKKITFKPKYKITIMKTPKLVQRLPYGFVLLPSPTAWLRWDGRRALIVLGLVWVLLAGGGTIGFWRTTVFRLCSNSVLPWVTRCMLRSCDFSDPGTFVKFNSLYLSLSLLRRCPMNSPRFPSFPPSCQTCPWTLHPAIGENNVNREHVKVTSRVEWWWTKTLGGHSPFPSCQTGSRHRPGKWCRANLSGENVK